MRHRRRYHRRAKRLVIFLALFIGIGFLASMAMTFITLIDLAIDAFLSITDGR